MKWNSYDQYDQYFAKYNDSSILAMNLAFVKDTSEYDACFGLAFPCLISSTQFALLFANYWKKDNWIHTFPRGHYCYAGRKHPSSGLELG